MRAAVLGVRHRPRVERSDTLRRHQKGGSVRYIALPWEIKDRLNRYLTWTSWALIALALATIFFDIGSRYLVIALALYLPAILFSTIRDWRSLNKDVAEMR